MVRLENHGLSREDYVRFRNGVHIEYGAQTKCRNCKVIRGTSEPLK
jgi:hypothetical protein